MPCVAVDGCLPINSHI